MMSNSQPAPEFPQKPAPSDHTTLASPTNTVTTAATRTARTSEDSKSDKGSPCFRCDAAGSTPLSPIDPVSPLSENWVFEPLGPRKLQKAPIVSLAPQPPPPAAALPKPGTPPPVPAVTQPAPSRGRSPSPERPPSRARLQPNRLQPRHVSPAPNPRGRSVSAQPPPVRGASVDGPRAVSSPIDGRPQSNYLSEDSPPGTSGKRRSRKSWFPGLRPKFTELGKPEGSGTWIMAPDGRVEYNTAPLVNGEKVPELWNEVGNVYVYLHPKDSGRGPCFKVADQTFSSSALLNEFLVAEIMAAMSHEPQYLDVAPGADPGTEGHLYLPLGNADLESLVAARNLFALLTHQPLVATSQNPTVFDAVLQVAGLLRRFNFSSYDGSSFGESVDVAFDHFMQQFGLADARHSPEKTIEAVILAEQMKSCTLYNEAFAHAVGKYESLLDLKSPLFNRVSVDTRKRLERAHLDLVNRLANVNGRLEAFEFPSLFAGIASSTSTEEFRKVNFKEWRNSFAKMRSFVLGYYKGLFGSWPPKARSRKNHFSQSGLNRQCLKILYSDLCALYDLLVDRQSLTPRAIGESYEDGNGGSKEKKPLEASISALRKVLSEFEMSSPPVLPPIPFDIPKIPNMTAIYEKYNDLPAKKQAKYSKALQPHELQLILIKSHNIDTDALQMSFLLAYKDFELKEAKGANPQDLADQRIGYWLFLYVVLQSLPMLVVDAPGLRYTDGVEDFLCEAPRGNPPWAEHAGEVRKMWYQTADQNIVELSADVVMFSVEGIYMRSHCWLAAKEWEATGGAAAPPPPPDLAASPLQPSRPVFRGMDPFPLSSSAQQPEQARHRSLSAAGLLSAPVSPHLPPRSDRAFRASVAIGLEPLPLPGVDRGSRVLSTATTPESGPSRPGSSGGLGLGAGGGGDTYQLGLSASRSAVNLSQFGGGGAPLAGANGELLGGGWAAAKMSSYGGSSGMSHGRHAVSQSLGAGGSTFDDILKGMDGEGKKKKKSLFF